MPGVYVGKGMQVGVPVGGLRLSLDKSRGLVGSLRLQLQFDVVPSWLEIALKHLADAEKDRTTRINVWSSDDEASKTSALENEFRSSMQAIMAAAIALDAFYAVLRDKVRVEAALLKKWRTNRTARYRQVTEVVRRSFGLHPRDTGAVRENLKEIYRLRDLAVHPDASLRDPVHHPELGVAVEWRFAYFRFENVLALVRFAVEMLHELVSRGKPASVAIKAYAENIRPVLDNVKGSKVLETR